MRPRSLLALVIAAALAPACASTAYRPRTLPGELALGYDGKLRIWTGDRSVARAPRFEGLEDFVACVPDARRHAEAARIEGARGSILSSVSIGLAAAGLAGLSGLAFHHRDDRAMAALLIGGVVVEVAAVAVAGSSFSAKVKAQGNAIDAVNFYNDEVGSHSGTCPARL
jgi:hypothetical protein